MGWTDYVPILGPLAKGDYKGAGFDIATGGLYTPVTAPFNAYSGAIDEQRQGYGKAATDLRAHGDKMRDFYMGGLDKAENYYEPARQRLTAAFGTPGAVRK